MAKIPTRVVGEDGWTEWIGMRDNKHRIVCCDCGLAHDFEFQVVEEQIELRARRNERSTGQIRRHMNHA